MYLSPGLWCKIYFLLYSLSKKFKWYWFKWCSLNKYSELSHMTTFSCKGSREMVFILWSCVSLKGLFVWKMERIKIGRISHFRPSTCVRWSASLNQRCLCFPLVGAGWVWPPSLFVAMSCPPSLVYSHCERGCPRLCEGNVSSCAGHPSEGCFCPPHQVLLEGSCVSEEACTQCISKDGVRHQVGALAFYFPWGCFSLGSVVWSVHQWLFALTPNCGSKGQLLRGSLKDREAVWHNGFGAMYILVQILGLSDISCVKKPQRINSILLWVLLLSLSLYSYK